MIESGYVGGVPTQLCLPGSFGRLNRPPSVDDNANYAYTATSDVWQFNKKLYSPVAAPDTNSAVWQELNSANGQTGAIADIATGDGGTVVAAYGLYAVKGSYTGACFDYSATVNAGTVTGTINIVAGGELDIAALGALMAKADAGTKIVVTKWYDQSGSGNDATRVAANGLYIEWDESLQSYALVGEIDSSTDRNMIIPATVTGINTRTYSAHFIGRGVNAEGKFDAVVGSLGDVGSVLAIFGNDPFTNGGNSEIKPSITIWQSTDNARTPNSGVSPLECGPCIAQFLPAAGSTTYWVNENTASNSAAPTSATLANGGRIGGWSGSSSKYAAMRYTAVLITSTAMSAATAKKIRYAAYRRFNIKPQAKDNVVFIGDSRMQGSVQVNRENLAMAVQARLRYPARVINCGNSGWSNLSWSTVSTGTAAIANLSNLYRSGRRNVAIVWLGVNDFLVDAASAATSFSRLTANIATLKAQGWYVILLQEAATTNAGNSASTLLPSLRALIAAGPTGADEVLDLTGYTPWLAASNATHWPDGLHPAAGLVQMAASKVADRVDAQLALGQALP